MKILINALSGIGDALMFSPALKLLSENNPEYKIDMLVMYEAVKEIYTDNSYLNNIYFIDFFNQSKIKSLKQIYLLRKNTYDFSINVYPSNRFEYNFLNYLIGAKSKIAHTYTHTNSLRFESLNSKLIKEIPDIHNVLQNVNLVTDLIKKRDNIKVGGLDIFLNEANIRDAKVWAERNGLRKNIKIGIHPGSSTLKNHINKRWDKDKFTSLIGNLSGKYDVDIILFGNEHDLLNYIKSKIKIQNLFLASFGKYIESVSLMNLCSIFISNDTAFLHTAAALKIPTVAIFGYTNSNELFPWNNKHIIVRKDLECSPCFFNSPKPASCKLDENNKFKCMKDIEVSDVEKACDKLIQEIPDYRKS